MKMKPMLCDETEAKIPGASFAAPRTADYEMKPMLGDETEDQNPGASFAATRAAARARIVAGRIG